MWEWQHLHRGCAVIGGDFQDIGCRYAGTYGTFGHLYAFLEMLNVI